MTCAAWRKVPVWQRESGGGGGIRSGKRPPVRPCGAAPGTAPAGSAGVSPC